jgi:hypothetical protein
MCGKPINNNELCPKCEARTEKAKEQGDYEWLKELEKARIEDMWNI